jgi:hypothetical protein
VVKNGGEDTRLGRVLYAWGMLRAESGQYARFHSNFWPSRYHVSPVRLLIFMDDPRLLPICTISNLSSGGSGVCANHPAPNPVPAEHSAIAIDFHIVTPR